MGFRSLFAFWKSRYPGTGCSKSSPDRRHRFRPCLEGLEDRCVPSTLKVTNSADDGTRGTLRWAVAHVRNGDTIDILTTQPIVLTQGVLDLYHSTFTIEAPAASPATISGGGHSQVFYIDASIVTLQNLKITWCYTANGYGGAIYVQGYLTLNNCTVTGNSATHGGAIAAPRLPSVLGGTAVSLVINNSTLSGNSATTDGGAIYVSGSGVMLQVNGSTLSGNSAADGGAIYLGGGHGAEAWVYTTILTNNSASQEGGAIYVTAGSNMDVSGDTFSGNTPDNIYGRYYGGGNNGL